MLHVTLARISPLAVPVLTLIGRESVAQGLADDALLMEAEALARRALQYANTPSLRDAVLDTLRMITTCGARC